MRRTDNRFGMCAGSNSNFFARSIRGIPADYAAVVVSTPTIGRMQDVRLDMGPGTCKPLVSNDQGVFLMSDRTVVVRSWIMISGEVLPGGVFVPDDPAKPCKPFYYRQGLPIPVEKTEKPTTVTLIDTRTNKKKSLRME